MKSELMGTLNYLEFAVLAPIVRLLNIAVKGHTVQCASSTSNISSSELFFVLNTTQDRKLVTNSHENRRRHNNERPTRPPSHLSHLLLFTSASSIPSFPSSLCLKLALLTLPLPC